ncbi:hypothetical protein R0131_15220 [Clostridium sp. AL.422]|uniref:hypothetical protein n=1 Tax=Clostridium TaxID=1485 RepID=UPI00293DBCCE|nr:MULTISPECIES: hypothetical protein [unclassified Clostridium]MDV4152177.1 hypothetical protein [Clostridium sp. AL.422]
MKKYVRNHSFIPVSFIEKIETTSYEKNNKLILFLLILNLFIIPNSLKKMPSIFKNNEEIPVVSVRYAYEDTNKKNLALLFNTINDNHIKSMRIDNNRGIIEVNSIEDLYNMEDENKFKIKSVDMKEHTIIVEVEL